jgi:DUF4097 and DUF4098 domain-containing protein YvlB
MRNMGVNRVLAIAAAASVALGLVLVTAALALGAGGGSVVWTDGGLRVHRSGDAEVLAERGLVGVTALTVAAVGADVEFVPADSFGFEVRTFGGTPTWSLDGGVLSVKESEGLLGSLWSLGPLSGDDAYVKVFYPNGATLDSLKVTSVSGALKVSGLNIEVRQTATLETTSGAIQFDSLKAGSLSVGTTSGDISSQGVSAPTARVGTTSGEVEFQGFTGRLDADSVSGDIKLSGGYQGGTVGSTSGNITIATTESAQTFGYHLETLSGGIDVNGQPVGSPANSATSGDRELTVRSTSGHIAVDFG